MLHPLIKLAYDIKQDFSVIGGAASNDTLVNKSSKDLAILDLLPRALDTMLAIASGLAILSLIIGAAQYLLAGGDPQKAEMGKKTILWTIIGMVSLILFYVILRVILKGESGLTGTTGGTGGILPQ